MDTALRTRTAVAPQPETGWPRLIVGFPSWWLSAANSLILVACLVFLYADSPGGVTMRTGEVAGTTVVAQRQVTYIDRAATAAKQRVAAAAITPVYQTDTSLAEVRRDQAQAFLTAAGPILAGNSAPSYKLITIRKLLPATISPTALQLFPTLTANDFKVVEAHSLTLLSQAVAWRFDSNQRINTEFGLLSTVPSTATVAQRTAIGEILATFLTPTLVPDPRATTRRQNASEAQVAPVVATIFPGEVVIRSGDMVTPTVMEKIRALGLQSSQVGWQHIVASLVFAVMVVVMLFWYLRVFHAGIMSQPRLLLFVDASILAAVAGARLLTIGHVLLPYFLPVAAAGTFAAVLMAPEACIALAFAIAILAGWVVANSFELTTYYFLSSAAGVLAIRSLNPTGRQVRQLKQFILAGLSIALFALGTLLAFGLVDKVYDLAALQEYVLAAAFNGVVSSTLALGGFALLSSFFGVTTSLKLLELAQPNQPLLRRLMQKAPGTYNHSLILATMLEHAAEEIGADALTAKVSALYHDVGKSSNPHCFVENQLGIGNIHDELPAEESARIIRGHVSTGLRLGRQYHLPRVVLDAIREHHGTMTIAYFLHKATQDQGGIPVDDTLFSYAGPKPQSKETALLMLADACESAVRAAQDHSRGSIQEIVDRMFAERMASGQLSECPLTLSDLTRAREAFCSVLFGLYHPRIEYPDQKSETGWPAESNDALPSSV